MSQLGGIARLFRREYHVCREAPAADVCESWSQPAAAALVAVDAKNKEHKAAGGPADERYYMLQRRWLLPQSHVKWSDEAFKTPEPAKPLPETSFRPLEYAVAIAIVTLAFGRT